MISFKHLALGLLVVLLDQQLCRGEDLQTTKVFILPIEPRLFNWSSDYFSSSFWYRASMLNAPDLPHWMTYQYSKRHRKGFIYGVPPSDAETVDIEIIGMNRNDYQTRRTVLNLNITDKPDKAKYEVRLKIDNLNIEDMFDSHRLFSLLRIFTTILWPESASNLYMTFLTPAVKFGARLPLHPNEGEGIVIHLGSTEEFSNVLIDLQEEVKPLWKLASCPRDFKRSTVDRHFRSSGPYQFLIDWCSFRLTKVDDELFSNGAHYQESSVDKYNIEEADDNELVRSEEIPVRAYATEIVVTLVVPSISLLILGALLSVILCFQHDYVVDPKSEQFFESIFTMCEHYFRKDNKCDDAPYNSLQRTPCHLKLAPDSRAVSPRLGDSVDGSRPSPPPYSASKRYGHES